jgi:titin
MNGANTNTIGGTTAGAGDIISGNAGDGVQIDDNYSQDNVVEGDHIGTDASGELALGNGRDGVYLWAGGELTTIGGTSAAARNVISGNAANGVIIDLGSSGNKVQGNFIGTDATGARALPNGNDGVLITGDSAYNTIGGTTLGSGNVISGNVYAGVMINGARTSYNIVASNFIGTDASSTVAVGNGAYGVLIDQGASNNTVGATTPAARNVISGNVFDGVYITDAGTTGNVVEGDYIGSDETGTVAVGNGGSGVEIVAGATNNTVGSPSNDSINLIEYNQVSGVFIAGATTTGNVLESDIIALNGMGAAPGVGDGVFIEQVAGTLIEGCFIEANRDWGIALYGAPSVITSTNTVLGNGLGSVVID